MTASEEDDVGVEDFQFSEGEKGEKRNDEGCLHLLWGLMKRRACNSLCMRAEVTECFLSLHLRRVPLFSSTGEESSTSDDSVIDA